ncbi:MAG TPA: OmpA family protein [Nevskiaceae bacterium]|nr:OmpA family protein [Nevskiaceae bacterium]
MKQLSTCFLLATCSMLGACSNQPDKFYSTFFLPKNPAPQKVQVADTPDCTVYFDLDSAKIRADQTATLDRCAQYLSKHPEQALALEGHADERGGNQHNLKLGEQRAEAVKQALFQRGISGEHISVASLGEEHVAQPGEPAWSHSRRVDAQLAPVAPAIQPGKGN